MRLHVPNVGCSTCPYRRDTPPGVWAPEEYEKLRSFDREPSEDLDCLRTFHCHQGTVTGTLTVCRGWLDVHQDSVAVRLAAMNGAIAMEDIPDEHDALYYASGNEAADAGLAGVDDKSAAADKAIGMLTRSGNFQMRDDS